MTAPTVEYAPAGSVARPAHVVEAVTPAPAAPARSSCSRGSQSLVDLSPWECTVSAYRVTARRSQPLRSAFQRFCTRLGLQASQVRFFLDGLIISPFDTPDRIELVDGDLLEGQRVMRRRMRMRTRMKTPTSSLGTCLVFLLGSCPCGCAGGTLLGTAGRRGSACSLTTRTNCTPTLVDETSFLPACSRRSYCFISMAWTYFLRAPLLAVTWVSALPVEHLDNWFFWEMTS